MWGIQCSTSKNIDLFKAKINRVTGEWEWEQKQKTEKGTCKNYY